MGPIMVRRAGEGVRPEWFALLPFPPRRVAAGLLGASFVGVAPALTLVAFAALPAAASRLGLLPVAPATVALTVAVTAFAGQGWAWPWIFATLPAVLGGTAGLTVWISAARPTREKDPQRRTSPYDTSDDPSAAGALIGGQYLMLLLAALTAVPAGALVLAGAARHQPVLQAAGVLAGIATGVLLYWWGGRAATRRLAGRGAELMDLLNLGPQAQSPRSRRAGSLRDWLRPAREPGAPLRRGKAALRGVLLTVGILCIVPQGLVPI